MAGNKRPRRKASGVGKSTSSNSSLMIRYSAEEDAMLKEFPRRSLARIVESTAGQTEWSDVFFRIHTGLELAKLHIAQDVTSEFSAALTAMEAIELRASSEALVGTELDAAQWSAGVDEVAALEIALDMTDQIQDATTRKEQLKVYLAVEDMMKKRAARGLSGTERN